MKKRMLSLLLSLLLIFSISGTTIYAENGSSKEDAADFELHMLNVGEGLSILIRDGGKYLLYDGGDAQASSYVVAYLQKQEVEKLNYIIVSHYDADHLNGVIGALHTFKTDKILEPDYDPENDLYHSYDTAAETSGAERIHPKPGNSYTLNKAKITVLGPKDYKAEDVNDRSIAVRVEYKDTVYLICADASEKEELEILNSQDSLKSDVYVIDHHGSAASSSDLFLGNVKPQYALLSCGKDNTYGHPAERVLESLKKLNCQLYRTDVQGEIVLRSDGQKIEFNVKPTKDWGAGKRSDSAKEIDVFGDNTEKEAEDSSAAASSGTEVTVIPERTVPEAEETPEPTETPTVTYICNTNTHKFHYTWCNSVKAMKDKNKLETTESRDTLIAQGYESCGNCKP